MGKFQKCPPNNTTRRRRTPSVPRSDGFATDKKLKPCDLYIGGKLEIVFGCFEWVG